MIFQLHCCVLMHLEATVSTTGIQLEFVKGKTCCIIVVSFRCIRHCKCYVIASVLMQLYHFLDNSNAKKKNLSRDA